MTLAPLVTGDQVLDRLGRAFTAAENSRIETLIADVSAAVRSYVGQQFTAGSDTVLLRTTRQNRILLPQTPVTAVSAVTDAYDNVLPFTWLGDNVVDLNSVWYLNVWELNLPTCGRFKHAKVTYTHGGAVPDDVVAAVCAIVARALAVTPDGNQNEIVQESIAGYSYTLRASNAQAGPFGITDDEKSILDRYKLPAGAIQMI